MKNNNLILNQHFLHHLINYLLYSSIERSLIIPSLLEQLRIHLFFFFFFFLYYGNALFPHIEIFAQ